ncbi:SAF domain-containing protein [Georgenia yuyongxinii]
MVALASAGGLGWMFSQADDAVEVIVAAQDVGRGQVIEAGDLTSARITLDPALSPIPASRSTELVGQRVSIPLTAGGLVTEAMLAPEVLPPDGMSLVPVTLPAERADGLDLQPGDRVKIVLTPPPGQEAEGNPPFSTAEVATVSPSADTVSTVVTLLVPEADGPVLAARLAAANFYLVLDSRER